MELNYFEISGAPLTTSQLTDSFASMLNDSDSCVATTYDQLLPSYDYLTIQNAITGLSGKTMVDHGNITADILWDILVDRYEVIPMGLSSFYQPQTFDHRFYLSIVMITMFSFWFFIQKHSRYHR
jgi:hypothetical protein